MTCRKLGTEIMCEFPARTSSAASEIASGVGDTIQGLVQFPTDASKYITQVDKELGHGRRWNLFRVLKSSLEFSFPVYSAAVALKGSVTDTVRFRMMDTAAHIVYGGLNTLTAGGMHTIFNEKLGLGIKYFTPPPKTLRESAQVFSGGLMVALPLKGAVLKGMKIKATTTIEIPPNEFFPNMGHPMEGSPFRRHYEPPQGPFPTRNIHGYEEVLVPERACVVGSPDFPDNPSHWTVSPKQWVSKNALTEGQFETVTGRRGNPSNQLDHPVTIVDWNNTAEYCQRAGVELLTSARFESANRGPAVKIVRKLDDGHVASTENFAKLVEGLENIVIKLKVGAKIFTATDPVLNRHLDQGGAAYGWPKHPTRSGHPDPLWSQRNRSIAPADTGPVNGYGLRFGNVWEWTKDWYKPIKPWPLWVQKFLPWLESEGKDFYRPRTIDPQGPKEGMSDWKARVVRGGSWIRGILDGFRSAVRSFYHPGSRYPDLGFRVARPAAGVAPGLEKVK